MRRTSPRGTRPRRRGTTRSPARGSSSAGRTSSTYRSIPRRRGPSTTRRCPRRRTSLPISAPCAGRNSARCASPTTSARKRRRRAWPRWHGSSARAATSTCRRARPVEAMRVTVIGAGVAGLTCALELADRGAEVEVLERGGRVGEGCCSWYAGGMLAPWCERESAEPLVMNLGQEALRYWAARGAGVARNGTLVVAQPRDVPELTRFARRTEGFEWVDRDGIAALEPD